jgi:putative ABC transport system permease protein
MLRNYIKIALRNLVRNKAYSAINILGLALGVACCLLLSLYVQDELSYDKQHDRLNDLYRIISKFESDNGLDNLPNASPPIAMALKEELPEVENAVRVLASPGVTQQLIRYKDDLFYETGGMLADSTLFDVFKYEMSEGNPKKALVLGNSVVLSAKLAHKLFGNEPALDQIITIGMGGKPQEYKVTGVFSDKYRSHIKANFFISMTSKGGMAEYIRTEGSQYWGGNNFVPSYLKLHQGHDRVAVIKKMNDILQKHGAKEIKALGMKKSLTLEPVEDIYLQSEYDKNPRITYLYVVASIAVFILLIACINFMNLSTAKATKRAAEIGIRKTMGAFRSSLIKQILGEAMIIVLFSIIISVGLVQLALPFFNQLTDKNISFNSDTTLYFVVAAIALTVVTGIVAGSYPAFYLSSFQPAEVLKGKAKLSSSSGLLRRSLVVFQFMIAITLVCGIFVISDQLNFMSNKNLGFDASQKIVLPLRSTEARERYDALKTELQKINNVAEVSGTEYVPGSYIWNDMMFYTDGGNMDKAILNRRNKVDVGYTQLMKIKIIAGRTFSENRQSESKQKLLINKTSADKFGFSPEKMVGQNLHFDWQGKKVDFEVIGVMEDFHQTSLHENIVPIMFEMADSTKVYDNIVVSLSSANFEQTVASMEKTWKSMINNTPFEYSFLNQTIQKQYAEDHRVSQIITTFAMIAMAICCLGLYGLSSYMAERKFKEIGIRKVMGASVQQIVSMMSTEFLKLVLVAFLIAAPIAWYTMNKWLQSFAFRIEISWMVFAFAGMVALAVALVTVSFESIKSAIGNPVESLRSE